MCDNTFSPQKCEVLTNLGLFWAFKAVNIPLGGIWMPNLKIDLRTPDEGKKSCKNGSNHAPVFFLPPVKF